MAIPLSYSDVLTLEREDKRLYLPVKMVEIAGWPQKGDAAEVVLELREPGRLRMFYVDLVRAVLNDRRAALVAELERQPFDFEKREALLQFEDRYPTVSYSPKSRRVALGVLVMVHIDPYPERSPDVFVQAAPGLIDVMSLELRASRLAQSNWSLAPP